MAAQHTVLQTGDPKLFTEQMTLYTSI